MGVGCGTGTGSGTGSGSVLGGGTDWDTAVHMWALQNGCCVCLLCVCDDDDDVDDDYDSMTREGRTEPNPN